MKVNGEWVRLVVVRLGGFCVVSIGIEFILEIGNKESFEERDNMIKFFRRWKNYKDSLY